MDIVEIIKDAVIFPSTDFKKVIFLGIFPAIAAIITLLIVYFSFSSGNYTTMSLAGTISLIITLLADIFVTGYVFRTIQATIAGSDELPEFEDWFDLIIDGIKVYIVEIIYLIIPLLVIFIGGGASLFVGSFGAFGIIAIIGVILAIIFEIIAAIAIAYMAYNAGELGTAFRFSEVMERIYTIGWGNYIIWII